MIPHPSRHFIYYLISRRAFRTAEILQRMGDLGLPLPTKDKPLQALVQAILVAQKKVAPPSGFTQKKDSAAANAFYDKWKIGDLWKRTPEARAAQALLTGNSEIRRSVELMLLGPIAPVDIAARIQRRYGLNGKEINAAVVKLYAHYFWNTGMLSKGEWLSLIDGWAGIEDRAAYLATYQSPRSPAGAAITLVYADRAEDELDPVHTYTTIRNLAFKQFMEVTLTAHPLVSHLTKAQAAMLSLQTMRMAEEELVKVRGVANNAFLAQLSRIEAKHDRSLPISAKTLMLEGSLGESPHGQIVDATVVNEET
jgi:hypothetical protein